MKKTSLYAGILLLALGSTLFEVALTRIFSVTLWYHFAFFVVSVALFGIGFGGLLSFHFEGSRRVARDRFLPATAIFQALFIVTALIFVLNVRIQPEFTLRGFRDLSAAYLICAGPFTVFGFIIAELLRRFPQDVAHVYFFDLLGAALSCLLFVPAISYVSGPSVVLLAALISLLGAVSLFYAFTKRVPASLPVFVIVLVILGFSAFPILEVISGQIHQNLCRA